MPYVFPSKESLRTVVSEALRAVEAKNGPVLPVATIHGSAPVYAAIGEDICTEERKALGLPTTVKPLDKSRQELGKLRRKHITITKRELGCGHCFAVGEIPHNNCDACWLTHFRTIPGIRWTDDAGAPYDGVGPVNAALHTVRPELVAQ